MTRKIVVSQYASLDGVIEDPVGMENSGLGNWIGPFERGPKGDQFKHEELWASTAVLLGRKTYDGFAAVWPTVNTEFAARINSLPKYVASSTLTKADWNNSTVLADDVMGLIGKLKKDGQGDILVYGSASLVHAMLPLELVDEVRLMVYPTVLGRGKRWFPEGWKSQMHLSECMTFGSGIVLLRYATSTNG
ncbi:MAG: dihydrofolate reductase family protein [Nitrososphaera sp.]